MTEYAQYIIQCIKNDLTGDYQKDMDILRVASEKYKMDEESSDILSAIAMIMYEILPENEKDMLSERMKVIQDTIIGDYNKVKEMIKAGEFVQALEQMESVLNSVKGTFMEEEDTIYMSFHHIMEYYLYSYYFQPTKNVITTELPIGEYYSTYGIILTHLQKYDAAIEAYQNALKWNPVDMDVFLSLSETYKLHGDLENYLKTTKQVYRFCCTRATMARYYRNYAFYFVETYQPEVARALYVYSNIFFQTENADNELQYIANVLQTDTPSYDLSTLQSILKQHEIQLGPDPTTIGVIFRVGQLMIEEGNQQLAKDCFSIVYDITQDKEAEEYLNQLQ